MQTLKVNFGYFWPGFKNDDNFFTRILSEKYKVELSDEPDFFFFTHPYDGKRDYLKHKCHRIFLGWENQRADWNICDYVMDSDFVDENPRHKRFPIWAGWELDSLTKPRNAETLAGKSKFCCMLVSNANAVERIEFFNQLSKYKKVDSAGRYLNNIGRSIENKMDFIKDYRFVISFENSSSPGYTTEKLIEPMLVNSIPVYWGNPVVEKDFNPASFINIQHTGGYEAAIRQIIELDTNESMLKEMAMEPWFINNKIPVEMSKQSLAAFFDFIIEDSKTKRPVATIWRKDTWHRLILFKNKVNNAVRSRLRKLYR